MQQWGGEAQSLILITGFIEADMEAINALIEEGSTAYVMEKGVEER